MTTTDVYINQDFFIFFWTLFCIAAIAVIAGVLIFNHDSNSNEQSTKSDEVLYFIEKKIKENKENNENK